MKGLIKMLTERRIPSPQQILVIIALLGMLVSILGFAFSTASKTDNALKQIEVISDRQTRIEIDVSHRIDRLENTMTIHLDRIEKAVLRHIEKD